MLCGGEKLQADTKAHELIQQNSLYINMELIEGI